MRVFLLVMCSLMLIAPSIVTNLTAERVGDRIVLEWTASGFEGGAVDGHDIRYSSESAVITNWGGAPGVTEGNCANPRGYAPSTRQYCVIVPGDIDSSARYFRLVPFVLGPEGAQYPPELSNIAPVTARLAGDVTRDATVGIDDLLLVLHRLGTSDEVADVNEDGVVDLFDLVIVAREFGQTVEVPELAPEAPPGDEPLPPIDTLPTVEPWYELHWDFTTEELAPPNVFRVIVQGAAASVQILENQPGGLTTTGNVLRANYGDQANPDNWLSPEERYAYSGVDLLPPRASIDRPREYYVEVMMRYDENWATITDDKTFFILQDWSADLGPGYNEVNRWDFRHYTADRWWLATDNRANVINNNNPPNAWDGEWNRMRIHARMATNDESCDAIARMWWNEELVLDGNNLCITGTPPNAHFRNIALGRNADPSPSGVRDWGRVRIWIEDPGW